MYLSKRGYVLRKSDFTDEELVNINFPASTEDSPGNSSNSKAILGGNLTYGYTLVNLFLSTFLYVDFATLTSLN